MLKRFMSRRTLRDGGTFIPTRGPLGSVYQTQDGMVYVRTPFGHRKIEPSIGRSLLYRDRLATEAISSRLWSNLYILLLALLTLLLAFA